MKTCEHCGFKDKLRGGLCQGCRSELARVGYLTDEKWHGSARKPASAGITIYDGGFYDEAARAER